MRAAFLASLPALLAAEYTKAQLALARKHIRQQILHHTNVEDGDVVEEFVEKMIGITLADTDNNHKLEDWTEETNVINTARGDVIEKTFTSPSFKLMTGNAHFTLNPLYRVPLPKGDVMIYNQIWDIVRGDNEESVPLTHVYNHHWLIGGEAPLDLCEDDFFFGGGAEYRTMDYTMLEGYGQPRIGSLGDCGGNFHFINTEDLLLEWDDFNNPNGDSAAAAKLCAECGWEPNRADGLCEKWGDGSFICCFTESRCKVNNQKNKTKLEYKMKGKFYYSHNFADTKGVQINLVDIGGNARTENGQMLDQLDEWNVDANLNNVGMHQQCNDTVCTMTNSYVIGDGSHFGYGICSGEMLWSYIHVHVGTLGGTVQVNGQQICDVAPIIGTDPNNAPGNEQGYLVGVEMCIDHRTLGNKIRLNKGDVLTATALYDVDKKSKLYAPLPGGKHGGAMALFFSVMDCDEGTWGEVYVVRNETCVGAPRSKSDRIGTFYNTRASCEARTDAQEPTPKLALPEPEVKEPKEIGTTVGKKVNVEWRDCGSSAKWVNFTKVTPATMGIGGYQNIQGYGDLNRDIEAANFTIKMSSGGFGMTLMDFSGEDACNGKVGEWTLADQIHLTWFPLSCPVKAGPGVFSSKLRLFVDPLVPMSAAHTTTTVLAHSPDGEEIFCIEVVTQAPPSDVLV